MSLESRLYFCGDDLIQRGIYAQNIKSIVKNCNNIPKANDNNSYVIGINAPWGSGKTYFMKMLQSYLEGEWEKPDLDDAAKENAKLGTGAEAQAEDSDKYTVIYYDAWENDFWDNAFEPLFDNLMLSAPLITEKVDKDIAELGKTAAQIIALGIKGFVSKKIDDYFDTGTINDINKKIKEFSKNLTDDYQTSRTFPEYDAFVGAIRKLKEYLAKAVNAANGRLVIIIDELDRCKPTFAVQTLEIVKHLFNVEGLVFIFALDIHQLSHSVKVVYGNGFDAVGYLERFFNYLTILPHRGVATTDQSLQIINKMDIQDKFANINANLMQKLLQITEMFNLSLREVKTVFSAYSVLIDLVLRQYSDYPNAMILYFYFLCMKYKEPVLFSDGVFRNGAENVKEFVGSHIIPFTNCMMQDYKEFNSIINDSITIANTEFVVIRNGMRQRIKSIYNPYIITGTTDKEFILNDEAKIPFEKGLSLSLWLYTPDLLKFERIKDFTLLEYIFRQLEMCDFVQDEVSSAT